MAGTSAHYLGFSPPGQSWISSPTSLLSQICFVYVESAFWLLHLWCWMKTETLCMYQTFRDLPRTVFCFLWTWTVAFFNHLCRTWAIVCPFLALPGQVYLSHATQAVRFMVVILLPPGKAFLGPFLAIPSTSQVQWRLTQTFCSTVLILILCIYSIACLKFSFFKTHLYTLLFCNLPWFITSGSIT